MPMLRCSVARELSEGPRCRGNECGVAHVRQSRAALVEARELMRTSAWVVGRGADEDVERMLQLAV